VFECEINEMQFEVMRSKLLKTIDANTDSLRSDCLTQVLRDKPEAGLRKEGK
jgi:CRISPR/Cas system-associated endoribonuclease Cas2